MFYISIRFADIAYINGLGRQGDDKSSVDAMDARPLTASLDGEGWVETEGYVDMPFQGLRLRPFGKLIVCYGKWPHL